MEISLQQIARALNGEVRGEQVLAPGPNHSPQDRSLSVKLSNNADGGFICKSFAGDDWRTCKDHILERLGLPKFEPRGRHNGRRSEADIIAAVVAAAEQEQAEGKAGRRLQLSGPGRHAALSGAPL